MKTVGTKKGISKCCRFLPAQRKGEAEFTLRIFAITPYLIFSALNFATISYYFKNN
jgi:hypothetical protein